MHRLLFSKEGNAVWISHLDLMRLFQRAFKRAGLPLKHTQGFNPRPSVSIALPLSVGIESSCELLDFEIETDGVSCEEIKEKLNHVLIPGVHVIKAYENGEKIKNLSLLACSLNLEYDNGIPVSAVDEIMALFTREEVVVEKKGKNGVTQQNLIPMIKWIRANAINECEICVEAMVCCQNPSLNPMQIATAIRLYLPHLAPDFVRCKRNEIYNVDNSIFR